MIQLRSRLDLVHKAVNSSLSPFVFAFYMRPDACWICPVCSYSSSKHFLQYTKSNFAYSSDFSERVRLIGTESVPCIEHLFVGPRHFFLFVCKVFLVSMLIRYTKNDVFVRANSLIRCIFFYFGCKLFCRNSVILLSEDAPSSACRSLWSLEAHVVVCNVLFAVH
jgi:hypothetical protein